MHSNARILVYVTFCYCFCCVFVTFSNAKCNKKIHKDNQKTSDTLHTENAACNFCFFVSSFRLKVFHINHWTRKRPRIRKIPHAACRDGHVHLARDSCNSCRKFGWSTLRWLKSPKKNQLNQFYSIAQQIVPSQFCFFWVVYFHKVSRFPMPLHPEGSVPWQTKNERSQAILASDASDASPVLKTSRCSMLIHAFNPSPTILPVSRVIWVMTCQFQVPLHYSSLMTWNHDTCLRPPNHSSSWGLQI